MCVCVFVLLVGVFLWFSIGFFIFLLLLLLNNFIWWGFRLESATLKNHAEETKIKARLFEHIVIEMLANILYTPRHTNKVHSLTLTGPKCKHNHTYIKRAFPSKWQSIHSIWNTVLTIIFTFSPTHLLSVCGCKALCPFRCQQKTAYLQFHHTLFIFNTQCMFAYVRTICSRQVYTHTHFIDRLCKHIHT